jgi:hypothetical protein
MTTNRHLFSISFIFLIVLLAIVAPIANAQDKTADTTPPATTNDAKKDLMSVEDVKAFFHGVHRVSEEYQATLAGKGTPQPDTDKKDQAEPVKAKPPTPDTDKKDQAKYTTVPKPKIGEGIDTGIAEYTSKPEVTKDGGMDVTATYYTPKPDVTRGERISGAEPLYAAPTQSYHLPAPEITPVVIPSATTYPISQPSQAGEGIGIAGVTSIIGTDTVLGSSLQGLYVFAKEATKTVADHKEILYLLLILFVSAIFAQIGGWRVGLVGLVGILLLCAGITASTGIMIVPTYVIFVIAIFAVALVIISFTRTMGGGS